MRWKSHVHASRHWRGSHQRSDFTAGRCVFSCTNLEQSNILQPGGCPHFCHSRTFLPKLKSLSWMWFGHDCWFYHHFPIVYPTMSQYIIPYLSHSLLAKYHARSLIGASSKPSFRMTWWFLRGSLCTKTIHDIQKMRYFSDGFSSQLALKKLVPLRYPKVAGWKIHHVSFSQLEISQRGYHGHLWLPNANCSQESFDHSRCCMLILHFFFKSLAVEVKRLCKSPGIDGIQPFTGLV